MASMDSILKCEFNNDYGRLCMVHCPDGTGEQYRKAMFHEWVHWQSVVKPMCNNIHHPVPYGQTSNTYGLVEYEDGSLDFIIPRRIKFVDGKVSTLWATTGHFEDELIKEDIKDE